MTEYSSKQQEDFEDHSDPMEEVSDHLVALAELPVKVVVGGVVGVVGAGDEARDEVEGEEEGEEEGEDDGAQD